MKKHNFLKSWLIFIVVATIGGALVGGIGGLFLGLYFGIIGKSVESYKFLFQAVGFLLAMPISYYTYKWTVIKFILEDSK